MKVSRTTLAAAASIQFASLSLLSDHQTYLLGAALAMATGTILLLLALAPGLSVGPDPAQTPDASGIDRHE